MSTRIMDYITRIDPSLTIYTNVKSPAYGALGSALEVSDAAMTSGQDLVNCASAPFTPEMVGWKIDVNECGALAADIYGITVRNNQAGTIVAYNSPTQVQVSFTASATVSGKIATFGPDSTAAINHAKTAASAIGSALYVPAGKYVTTTMVDLPSNMTVFGDGKGVSIIYQIGSTRNASGTFFDTFRIMDGVHDVMIRDLSLRGTNNGAVASHLTTYASGYSRGIYMSTGETGVIRNITVQNCEMSYHWGQGHRGDGDVGDQRVGIPTIYNVKFLGCDVVNNADNGLNPHVGGGLEIAGCYLSGNSTGIEFAGSKIDFHDNIVHANRRAGCAIGGLGNPSQGKDNLWHHNIVTRNGTAGVVGIGMQIGGNVVHAEIHDNIIRENSYQGIGLTDSPVNFSSLSRDIRVHHNKIASNGLSGNGQFGIVCGMPGVVIEANDVFDDGVSGYTQAIGILIPNSTPNCSVVRNRCYGNLNYDYVMIGINTKFIDDYPERSVVYTGSSGDPAYSGTVDTSGVTVTWKSGDLFNLLLSPSTIINIDGVDYPIGSVSAAPSGTCSVSGTAVTRTTGPSFDTAWAGKYIAINTGGLTAVYFLISSVTDGDHLTVTSTYGSPPSGSQSWRLRDVQGDTGSVQLNISGSAGTLSNKAYYIPAHFTFPHPGVGGALTLTNGRIIPTHRTHTFGTGLIQLIDVPFGAVAGTRFTIIPTGAFTTNTANNIGAATTATAARPMDFIYDGSIWWPSY